MRREDKRRMPRVLKVHLPSEYRLERVPEGYVLYHVKNWESGSLTRYVCGFATDATAKVIEDHAQGHHESAI